MYWQNRKYRVSEYICVRASGASERFLEVFNSFTVKKVSFFTINVKFKVILSSKSGGGGGGGCLYRPSPHPKEWGGGGIHPPSPRDLRQWKWHCGRILMPALCQLRIHNVHYQYLPANNQALSRS